MNQELNFDTRDLRKFEKTMQRMGGVPQKAATKAASKGLTVVRREVRKLVPVGRTGKLKRGLYRKGEKTRLKGRKVYELTFNPKMNSDFQKPIQNPGALGGKHASHAYYPNSIEYGFLARKKGGGIEYRTFSRKSDTERDSVRGHRKRVKQTVQGWESQKVPGQHFMLQGAQKAGPTAKNTMADTLIKEATKIWTQD